MTIPIADARRPTWRERAADRAVARATRTGGGRDYTRVATTVPMRDGVLLRADVYHTQAPRATVLIRSPYGLGFPLDLLHARMFARRGYQVVVQSVRGRAGSTGEFRPVAYEAADGRDTAAWLRAQDWYSGRLATFGGSYLGLAQWALLREPPEDCGAAVVVVGPHDFARAIWGKGGFALADMFGWSQAMAAPEGGGALRQAAHLRRLRAVAQEVVGRLPVRSACRSALAAGAPWFDEWLDHDDPADPYWQAYRMTEALERSEVPTLLIGGWRDAFLDQTLEQYDALRARRVDVAMTVGPWTHMETATRAAGHVTREALEWFDQCFDAGGPRRARVRVFVTGAGEWWTSEEWPPRTSTVELRLAAGRLVEGEGDGGRTSFTFDPADPTPAVGGQTLDPGLAGAKDNRALLARPDVVAFTGEPRPSPLELCGAPELEVRLSVANPYSDLFVRLCDVDGRGRSVNIVDAFAKLDAAVPAGQEQVVRLTLDTCWHRVATGHRLQLVVAGGAHPRYARSLGTAEATVDGQDLEVQPHTILHRGTTLHLPVVDQRD